jgi:hypothetical protein
LTRPEKQETAKFIIRETCRGRFKQEKEKKKSAKKKREKITFSRTKKNADILSCIIKNDLRHFQRAPHI